jgi:GntR family transcriptional regulator / MocR family aminotransferase
MSRPTHYFCLPLRRPRLNETLADWLYRELRDPILAGRLKPGVLLPPTRVLAAECGVARGTVVRAFEQLISEGYLESRAGSGTRVRRELPDQFFHAKKAKLKTTGPVVRGRLSKRGIALTATPFPSTDARCDASAFRANQPSVTHFPMDLWSRLSASRTRLATRDMRLSGDPLGYRPLRESIAAHLGSTRGVTCHFDQIFIVSGTQHALDLISRLTLDPGDKVWIEDPGYPGAASIFRAAGAKLVPIPVDEKGLRVAHGIQCARDARVAYITPANQFPLCVSLPLERRLQLLEWSRSTGAWIFEDDYDGEFRFDGPPLAALQGLAPDENVIFSGSFSKILFPSLRLGYLVAPPHLVEPLLAARSLTDRYLAPFAQAILCDFMVEGHFGRYLRRMRQIYAEHLDVLMSATQEEWGDELVVQPIKCGLQSVARLAPGRDDQMFARAALEFGVEMRPLSNWAFRWKRRDTLQIGFASINPTELRRGVTAISNLLGTSSN